MTFVGQIVSEIAYMDKLSLQPRTEYPARCLQNLRDRGHSIRIEFLTIALGVHTVLGVSILEGGYNVTRMYQVDSGMNSRAARRQPGS